MMLPIRRRAQHRTPQSHSSLWAEQKALAEASDRLGTGLSWDRLGWDRFSWHRLSWDGRAATQAQCLSWCVQEERKTEGPTDVVGLRQAHRGAASPQELVGSWCCSPSGDITAKCKGLLLRWKDFSQATF